MGCRSSGNTNRCCNLRHTFGVFALVYIDWAKFGLDTNDIHLTRVYAAAGKHCTCSIVQK